MHWLIKSIIDITSYLVKSGRFDTAINCWEPAALAGLLSVAVATPGEHGIWISETQHQQMHWGITYKTSRKRLFFSEQCIKGYKTVQPSKASETINFTRQKIAYQASQTLSAAWKLRSKKELPTNSKTRFEPKTVCLNQGCGAAAQAISDGWSLSQKLLDSGAEAWNLGSGSTEIVRGASYTNNTFFSDFLDQIVLEPEPKASRYWS